MTVISLELQPRGSKIELLQKIIGHTKDCTNPARDGPQPLVPYVKIVLLGCHLRSFPRNKIEHKIFVKLSQVVIYHGMFRNIR